MATGTYDKTDQPLTREDVEQLLQQEGSPDKLNLSGMNLRGIDLSGLNLSAAMIGGANLDGANLSKANLSAANLNGADLSRANLSDANLSKADLSRANLSNAELSGANLSHADLYEANLTDAKIDEGQLDKAQLLHKLLLHNIPVLGVLSDDQDFFHQKMMYTTEEWAIAAGIIPLRISEEPLTPYNLAIALTALTELTTKFWLIAKRRFDDLIEYTQTHDARFAKEAGATILYARYNSPFTFGFQVDKLVPSVADATMTVVNGLTLRKANLEKLELENQAAAQKIKEAEQKAQQEQQMAALEKEKQELALEKERLAIEEDRLALVEHRLDIQKKGLEDALELASKTVDILRPNADPDARAMMIQSVLPSILQLQNVTGLELALPPPKREEENN